MDSPELAEAEVETVASIQSTRSLPKLSELDLPAAAERVTYRCWQSGFEAGFADISMLINGMRDALELDLCRARAEATTRSELLSMTCEGKIR